MISEKLKSKALAFLNSVISDSHTNGVNDGKSIGYTSGYTKGYNSGLVEGKSIGYNSGYTKGYASGETEGKTVGYNSGKTDGYNNGFVEGKTVGYNNGKTEGYNLGLAEGKVIGYNSGYTKGYQDGLDKQQEQIDPITPDVPPIEPDVPTGSTEEYSSEKAKANLKALQKDSYVFAIMDKFGNAYKTVDDWKNGGSKEVLGIGFCSGNTYLCMGIKKVVSSTFGGDGVNFNSKVYTTTKQWHNTSTSTIAAFDDYTGVSNTKGIMEGCIDSAAEKCYNVLFANGKNGYLPACGEMRTYCKYFSQVDALLVGVGGDKLKIQNGAQLLWSSTCRDKNNAWAVRYMKDGDAQPAYRAKTLKTPSRVFVEL